LLADDDQPGVERGAEVGDEFSQQLVKLIFVESHNPPCTQIVGMETARPAARFGVAGGKIN
jgi:hypothetical protein